MIQSFKDGKDIYRFIASIAFGVSYDECREHNEDGSTYPEGKARRTAAKSVVLGRPRVMPLQQELTFIDCCRQSCELHSSEVCSAMLC